MTLTEEQKEAIRKVFLDANTDAYFDESKPVSTYRDRVVAIVECN